MQNDLSTNLGLPLPHPENELQDDVLRLRETIAGFDSAIHTINQFLFSGSIDLDSINEIVQVLANAQGEIGDITAALAAKADKATVDAALLTKANAADVTTGLAAKADVTALAAVSATVASNREELLQADAELRKAVTSNLDAKMYFNFGA